MLKVYCHPRCGTCKKALKYLDENNVEYEYINVLEQTPSADEMKQYHESSGLDFKKLFNTSGKLYRELGLKDKIKEMTNDEVYELLSSNGMLIKRPLVTNGSEATFGFKEEIFSNKWI